MTDYSAAPEFQGKAEEFCRKYRITRQETIDALAQLLDATAGDARRGVVSSAVIDLRVVADRLEAGFW